MARRSERAFPGLAPSIGLVLAVLAAELLVTWLLHGLDWAGPGQPPMRAALVATLTGNALVLGAFVRARRLAWKQILHPARASVSAVSGLLSLPLLLVSPGLFLANWWIDDVLTDWLPMSEFLRAMFEQMMTGGFYTTITMVVVAPFFEEVLFRGIVLRGLLARMPQPAAIVASALIFGAAHLNLYQFVGAGLLGLVLGWLYARFRSTWPCILLHATQNALVLLALGHVRFDTPASEFPAAVWVLAVAGAVVGVVLLRRLARLAGGAPETIRA